MLTIEKNVKKEDIPTMQELNERYKEYGIATIFAGGKILRAENDLETED